MFSFPNSNPNWKQIRLFILFIIIGYGNSLAQKGYKFQKISMQEGLANSQINCLLEDEKGYVWIGTQNGLNRFDGYQFLTFKNEPNNPYSLKKDLVSNLWEGPRHTLWINSSDVQQVFFLSQEEKFYSADSVLHSWGLSNDLTILKHFGKLYYFVGTNSINVRNENGEKVEDIILPKKFIVDDIIQKDKKILIINSLGELYQYENRKLALIQKGSFPVKNPDLRFSIFQDTRGKIWLYRTGEDFPIYTLEKQVWHPLRKDKGESLITAITEIDSLIWVTRDHLGLTFYARDSDKQDSSFLKQISRYGALSNSLTTMILDSKKRLWIGSFKDGLTILQQNPMAIVQHHEYFSDKLNVFKDINNFFEDWNGSVLIGTNSDGLIVQQPDNIYRKYTTTNSALSANTIISFASDRERNSWIGTYLGGINVFNGKSFQIFKNIQGDNTSLADDRVFALYRDHLDQMWIGTLGGGLDRYDFNARKFIHYKDVVTKLLNTSYISSISEDKNGYLWVGTNKGILIQNLISKKWIVLTTSGNNLKFTDILDLHCDNDGNMWVATRQGLMVKPFQTEKFLNYGIKDGLPDNLVLKCLSDKKGNIWLSTYNSISKINYAIWKSTRKISIEQFGIDENVQNGPFNRYSAISLRNGNLLFGGINGFTSINPDLIPPISALGQLAITQITVSDKNGSSTSILPYYLKSLQLPASQNNLLIKFAIVNPTVSPSKVWYRYRLEGTEQDWIYARQESPEINFANLGYGHYQLQLQASANPNSWKDAANLTLTLNILPPFYLSVWAILFYLLIAIIILYIGRIIIINKAHKRFSEKQKRKDELRVQKEDKLKIRFFTTLSHELRTPLSLILAPMESLKKEKSFTENQKWQLKVMERNAKRIQHFANQMLDYRKMEQSELQLHTSVTNIIPFIENVVNSFWDLAIQQNITLTFQSQDPLKTMAVDTDKLERTVVNILYNAFKFTPKNGTIHVKMYNEVGVDGKPWVCISIKDSGIGIDKKMQELIFTPFIQDHKMAALNPNGTGLGLALSQEFIKLHNGKIKLESDLGQGANFIVQLPYEEVENELQAKENNPSRTICTINKKIHVLIVEDNADFANYLFQSLGKIFTVSLCNNGLEAWNFILNKTPNIILSDINMPVMNGIELCQKVKSDNRFKTTPIVVMTAMLNDSFQKESWEFGASAFIAKPFQMETLVSLLNNISKQQEKLKESLQSQVRIMAGEPEFNEDHENAKFVKQIVKIIEKNLDDPSFSVEDLSKSLFISRVSLYKKLFSITGQAPLDFIRSIRLEHACQLLTTTQYTVAEVAYNVGFNDPKYFSKYFKSVYSETPSQYQEKHRKKEEKNVNE